jgi:hypothetical protein
MFSIPPRPIHRWKSLWLGILVIASLGWSWWESTQWSSMVSYRYHSLTHACSGISLAQWAGGSGPGAPLQWRREKFTSSFLPWSHPFFPAPETIRITGDSAQVLTYFPEEPISDGTTPRNPAAHHFDLLLWAAAPDSRAIFLPHWLIGLAFLIPWSALLAWRWKKAKHLTVPPNIKR